MNKSNPRQFWKTQPTNLPELNLLDVQKDSYNWFLSQGIKEALESTSPIDDFTGKNWRSANIPSVTPNPRPAKPLKKA